MCEWDEDKRAANIEKHGVDFAAVLEFEWDAALTAEDGRQDYGEARSVSIGFHRPPPLCPGLDIP